MKVIEESKIISEELAIVLKEKINEEQVLKKDIYKNNDLEQTLLKKYDLRSNLRYNDSFIKNILLLIKKFLIIVIIEKKLRVWFVIIIYIVDRLN